MIERRIDIRGPSGTHHFVLGKIVRWHHNPTEKTTVVWFDDGSVMSLDDEPGVIDDALCAAFYNVTPAELFG